MNYRLSNTFRPLSSVLFLLLFLFLLSGLALSVAGSLPKTLNISARGTDIRELLHAIAVQYSVNIVPDSDVTGTVTAHLANAPFDEGLQSMLEANGFQLSHEQSIYRVHTLPKQAGTLELKVDADRITVVADRADVRQVARTLSEQTDISFTLDADVQGTVTVNLKSVDLDTAIRGLFSDPQYLLRKRGEVYHLSQRAVDEKSRQLIFYQKGRVSMDLKDAPVTDVLTDLAEQAELNLVFVGSRGRSASGTGLTLQLDSIPLPDALDYVTSSAGLAYRRQVTESDGSTEEVYLVGDPTLQPGVDNLLLEQRVYWLKYLQAQEIPTLLPRDIPASNVSIDEIRNAVVVIGTPKMQEKVANTLAELDVENDTIRSRLMSALAVEVDAEGHVTIDAHEVPIMQALRELAVQADIDITLLGGETSSRRIRTAPSESQSAPQAAPSIRSSASISPLATLVNLRIQDADLDEAIQALLLGSDHTYRRTMRGERIHYVISPGNLRTAGSNPLLVTRRIGLRYLNIADQESLMALLPTTVPAEQVTFLPTQNAVAVIGTPEMVQEVEDYLRTIDSPAPQVMIEAMLLEIQRGDNRELGIRFGGEDGELGLDITAGAGVRFESLAQVPRSFQASLQALVSQNRARVLASPRVAVLNGQEATIRVGIENLFETVTEVLRGDEVPVGRVARQSFNSIQTGITLTLKPWIGADGDITLEIHPEVRDGTQISRDRSTIAERSIDTQIRIPDGGMISIGGLLQERESNVETGVPLLHRIPLLGGLFKDTNHQLSQTELIVVIRPTLVKNSGGQR